MDLVILGPPGAGKGTQAERLSEKYGWPQVATGDIFRAALSGGTPLGIEARGYMDAGELVPDRIVEEIVAERLGEDDAQDGFVLDGFPRSLHQAEALDRFLDEGGRSIDLVLNIVVDPEVLIERLAGRRVCRGCGANYHLSFGPPGREGVCDRCGGELYQRDDDNESTVRKRLEVYGKQTEPLLGYYEPSGLLSGVDGSGSPDGVFGEMCRLVDGVRAGEGS